MTQRFTPCHCGCGQSVNTADRWHFAPAYQAWFATPECFNAFDDAKQEKPQ